MTKKYKNGHIPKLSIGFNIILHLNSKFSIHIQTDIYLWQFRRRAVIFLKRMLRGDWCYGAN